MSETENGFPYPEPEDDIDVAGDFKRLAETTDTQLSSVRDELSGYLDSTQFQSRFQNLNKSPSSGSYEMTYGGIPVDGYSPGDMIVEETTLNGGLQAINRVDGDDPYRGSFLCVSQFYLEKSLLDSAFVSDIEARQSLSMLNEFFIDYSDWQKKLWSSGYNQISPTGRWACSGHAIQDGVDPNTPYKDLERDLSNLSDVDGNVPGTLEDAVSADHYRMLEFGHNEQTGDELRAGQFSIHHERLVHGSLPNATDRPRIGLGLFCMPTHVRSTLDRRFADLARGIDEFNYWDHDPTPETASAEVVADHVERAGERYVDPDFAQESAQ